MRRNLPVSQRHYDFPAHQTLISITDTKGRITYCNTDFIDVSGYTQDELLGQPHNLLRHPDMPEEAFRDFWDTVQNGKLWSGIIKNRRQNGDHYWVRANATPMRNGERIVGYLSVRTRPSEAEVRQAEQLYQRMRNEAEAGRRVHVLQRGTVLRRDLMGRVQQALRLPLWLRNGLSIAAASALPLALAVTGQPAWQVAPLALAAALASGAWLARRRQQLVHTVAQEARQLASGDLSQFIDVPARGMERTLLLPIAQLGLSIRTVMGDVRDDLQYLQATAHRIADSSQDMAARTETQASSLEQTAAAMDQINGTVQQTSELAANGVQLARSTQDTAARSQEAVRSMAGTMQEIAESSRRIGDITQNIEGVAFQTNILALNAAVEAARAGEQGRGFAVVATEVRALAQRTTTLAKEIRDLIAESQQRVAVGGARAGEARERMDEAMASVQQVGSVLEQIDHAAREQALGVRQVSEAVQHMDSITQQNAALVLELAQSAQSMDAQAAAARDNIRVFRLSSQDKTHAETDAVQLRREQLQTTSAARPALDYTE
ncbi:PAS domain-containing protein [Acidovorax sp. HDW3]|uniref:methyl-accepting chemotaxis protein n=1 Tax=Acidovorax sp. HDW3 TaxID=2714923 RepID=UPI00140D783D|nr:PAS domain-containing methyl-accepting chemotaxis protein [Acidovorax sp. HDW3]QIL45361.1 PAS domain-containing protein [Acidovorax sp. HDW3]